ncbi:MAG TPA: DUF4097 family beta strand repeat-containing protein [Bryobacteraceae bacterium]|nr:DUF4097 family beta strand repeat-containing protein [Bryobacteraceae bacterium]
MRRSMLLWPLLPGLLALAGCDIEDFAASERSTTDFHYSYALKSGGRLSLENFNGSVEITGWDQETVDISGAKYAPTSELRDAIQIDISHSPDAVSIRTVRPSDRRGNMGARYVVKVPRRTQLERIVSSNGSLRVNGIEGDGRLKTSNAAVRAADLHGNLDVQTSNGAIDLQGLEGAATLHTSNGHIHAEDVRGSVDASTSNGGVNVRVAHSSGARPVKIETSNGGVDLTLDGPLQSDVRVSTSNGGITVRLPQSINARLIASTTNNSINSEFEVKTQGTVSKHHLEGTIGSGGPSIDISTNNGGIRLLKL